MFYLYKEQVQILQLKPMLELYPNYITKHTRTLQEVVYIEKNKWKHKFVNYVTVNYVTAILLKSKYLSECIH